MSKKFNGLDIKEVWNYRLSSAVPVINREGDTWTVSVCAKDNPDYDGKNPIEPLRFHDTGIPSEPGDHRDAAKVAKCYEWLYSIRDEYALPNIEELKPRVAEIEAATAKLAAMEAAL